MADLPAWVALVSAFAGGGLVGAINFCMNWMNKKSEERRHLRTLIINAALEQWKHNCMSGIEQAKLGYSTTVSSLASHIIHMVKLSDSLLDSKITKDNIVSILKEVYETDDIAEEYIEKHLKNKAEGKNT